MSDRSDILLGVAGALACAAILFADDPADASTDPGGNTVSGNGFAINNPGNIRYSSQNNWLGQTGSHNGYCVFDTLAHGVRAMGILLTNYFQGGANTVTAIISKWSPQTENNTAAYIADVCGRTGFTATETLAWPADEIPLIQAIAYHENGFNNMSDSDVATYIGTS